jgi:hypothetical protein
LAVADERGGGVMALGNPVLALDEVGPVLSFERDGLFEPADAEDVHGEMRDEFYGNFGLGAPKRSRMTSGDSMGNGD